MSDIILKNQNVEQSLKQHLPLKGAFWICLSMASFSLINVTVKSLTGSFSSAQIAFFQNLFALLFLAPTVLTTLFVKYDISLLKTKRPILHICRVLASAAGVMIWYEGIASLPKIAQAVALVQIGPIFSILGAKFFLKEKLGTARLLMTIIAFCGAMVILHPTTIEVGLYSFLPLIAAACFSASSLMARSLSSTESPKKMVLYLLLFMTPATFLPALSTWEPVSYLDLTQLCLLGGLAAMAHYSLTKAYQIADASFLCPFGFAKFPITAFIAFLAFGQSPDIYTVTGGIIIIFASLFVIKIDHKKAQS